MIIRALEPITDDWTFGKGKQNYRSGSEEIAQDVKTKLLEFLNDAFWNLKAGVDWINLMRHKNTQKQVALSCRAVMLKAYGVLRVNQLDVFFEPKTRALAIKYSLDTIYTKNLTQSVEVINV